MRSAGPRLHHVLLGLALWAGLAWAGVQASEIGGLLLDSGPTGTRAELKLDGQADYRVISLANPDRLVIDLPGSRLASGFKLPAPKGLVEGVRSGQPEPGVTRIVFDLASAVVAMGPRLEPSADGARLVVEWPDESGPAGSTAPADGEDPIAALLASVSGPDHAPKPVQSTQASNAATDRLVAQLTARPSQEAAAAPPANASAVASRSCQ